MQRDKNTVSNDYYIRPYLVWEGEYRRYTSTNKFYELDVNASNKYFHEKNLNSVRSVYRDLDGINSLSFKIGTGRIEPITFVTLANFIYEDLKAENLINNSISQEELFALGKELTRAANLRTFDIRKRRKQQLKEICSFLQTEHNFDGKSQFDLFNIVSDNWIYALYSQRETGKRQALSLSPFYNYDINFFRNKPDELTNTTHGVRLGYEWLKSTARDKSNNHDIVLQVGYQIANNNNYNSSFLYDDQVIFANIGYSWKYMPSSRTLHDLTLQMNSEYLSRFDEKYYKYSVQPKLKYNLNYFINYNLRMGFDMTLNFGYTKTTVTSGTENLFRTRIVFEYNFF
jgi:hypothetical protein